MIGHRRLEYKVLKLSEGGWSVVVKQQNAPVEHWYGFSTAAQAEAWVQHQMLGKAARSSSEGGRNERL